MIMVRNSLGRESPDKTILCFGTISLVVVRDMEYGSHGFVIKFLPIYVLKKWGVSNGVIVA